MSKLIKSDIFSQNKPFFNCSCKKAYIIVIRGIKLPYNRNIAPPKTILEILTFYILIKNDVKTHKRALKSKISLRLRPRSLSSSLVSYKTPPYFSNSRNSAPILNPKKFRLRRYVALCPTPRPRPTAFGKTAPP